MAFLDGGDEERHRHKASSISFDVLAEPALLALAAKEQKGRHVKLLVAFDTSEAFGRNAIQ